MGIGVLVQSINSLSNGNSYRLIGKIKLVHKYREGRIVKNTRIFDNLSCGLSLPIFWSMTIFTVKMQHFGKNCCILLTAFLPRIFLVQFELYTSVQSSSVLLCTFAVLCCTLNSNAYRLIGRTAVLTVLVCITKTVILTV